MKRIGFLLLWFLVDTCGFSHSVPIKVKEGNIDTELVLSGAIEALEFEVIRAKYYSTVKRFAVEVGQSVKKGDLIAELEMDLLHKLEKLHESSVQFNEQRVKDAILDQHYNRTVASRQQLLSDRGIIPNKTAREANVRVSQQNVEKSKAQKSLLDSKNDLNNIQSQIQSANYYAPFDGIVTQLLVNPKQITGSVNVATDTLLAQIDKPGEYVVRATAVSSQVTRLKVGQKGVLKIGEKSDNIPCEISSISLSTRAAKEKMSLFDVAIRFKWMGTTLNKGILGTVFFHEQTPPVVMVPWNAVRVSPEGASVRLQKPELGWVEQKVVLGQRGKNRVQILQGLNSGDIVEADLW